MAGPSAVADRLRTGLSGCRPGVARLPVRGPVAAVRPGASGRDVSVPAAASRLQPAAAGRLAADQAGDPVLAADTDFWLDNVWIADSTPVECARSRPTVQRSAMAGWANYGYCASHSRWFWGLRLYLICTPAGMPITWALANPKLDEREVLAAMVDVEPELAAAGRACCSSPTRASRPGGSKPAWAGAESSCCALRCATSSHGPASSCSSRYVSSSSRSTTPSKASSTWNNTAAGPSRASPSAVAQRILAMATAIWHNHHTGQPITRSLIAYDH